MNLEDLGNSKKQLEKKHAHVCHELKALKEENVEIRKELSKCDIKLKTMKKEAKKVTPSIRRYSEKRTKHLKNSRILKL